MIDEVAVKTGKITSYPPFNNNITPDNDAKYEEFDVNALTREMFCDYVAAKNILRFFNEFEKLIYQRQLIGGQQDLVEILEFHHAPKNQFTITQIQEHFAYIAMQAAKYIHGKLSNDINIKYTAKLTVNGEAGYESEGLVGFVHALKKKSLTIQTVSQLSVHITARR